MTVGGERGGKNRGPREERERERTPRVGLHPMYEIVNNTVFLSAV